MIEVETRVGDVAVRGSNELARWSKRVYARSRIRLFGRVLWLGEERVAYEVIYRWLSDREAR